MLPWTVYVFAGALVLFLLYIYATTRGVKFGAIINKTFTRSAPEDKLVHKRPVEGELEIVFDKYKFDKLVKFVVDAGFDEKTGKPLIRYEYEDERGESHLSPFQIPDDGVNIRPKFRPSQLMCGEKRHVWIIVDDKDPLVMLERQKNILELQISKLLMDNTNLRKSVKEQSKEGAEITRETRRAATGYTGQGSSGMPSMMQYGNRGFIPVNRGEGEGEEM